jgi:hypothetical protein
LQTSSRVLLKGKGKYSQEETPQEEHWALARWHRTLKTFFEIKSCYVAQAALKLAILLPQISEC